MSFEAQEEEESEHQHAEAMRSVVLGTTTQKQSKKNKKLAITYRYYFPANSNFCGTDELYNIYNYRDSSGNELPKSVLNKIILFQKKQKKDTIDVWWLSDDGGKYGTKILLL